MSEISVVVVGGTTVNSAVGNGDTVNVSVLNSVGGQPGAAATVEVGSTKTVSPTSVASVVNVGTAYAAKLDFLIPQGVTGQTAPATSLSIGRVSTGATASVSISGTAPSQSLSFVLQPGPLGPPNSLSIGSVSTGATAAVSITGVAPSQSLSFVLPAGPAGKDGAAGITPAFSVSSVTTGDPGTSAAVTATTTNGGANVALAFTIPRGATGGGGGSSVSLSDSTPSSLGTASAGTSSLASRADHVHATPVISYTNLTNVPSTFAPSTHTHTASQITDFATTAAAAAPVQTVAGRTGNVVIATSDVVGLSDALSNVSVDVIDGGDYVGVVVNPTPTITITAQPQAQSGQTTASVTWDATQASGSPATPDFAFYDGSSLWAGRYATSASLYKRSSGSWSTTSGPAGRYMAKTSNALVMTDYLGRTVYRSTDGGSTWASSTRSTAAYVSAGYGYHTLSGFAGIASSGSVVAGINYITCGNTQETYGSTAFDYANTPLSTSTDNGQTWSNVSVSSTTDGDGEGAIMRGLVYANGRFVAVGVKSDRVAVPTGFSSYYDLFATALTSTDGLSWNAYRMASGGASSAYSNASLFFSPLSVAYGGGKFIAVGASTALDSVPAGGNVQNFGAAYGKAEYTRANGTRNILTSTDNGATWSTVSNALPVSSVWSSIIYAAGQWVAFQASGNSYATSPDGVTWTARALPTSKSGLGLYGNATYDDESVYVGGEQRVKIIVSSSTVSATFTVSAYLASGTLSYQWQVSADAGSTWSNVSGATNATLSLSATAADNGKRYRCVVSATGVASVTSNSATLTVT